MDKSFTQTSFTTIEGWFRRIPKAAKRAFLSSLIAGTLVYLFAMTNLLVSVGDALNNVISSSNAVSQGRWSCSWLSSLSTVYTIPLISGMIIILSIAILSALVVLYLDIRSPLLTVATSLVLVCYPSVGNTFKYLHMADAYMIAAMLAVLSLYLLDRFRFGWLVSIPLLTLALGTYQAYVSLVIALMFVKAIKLILHPASDNRSLVRLAIRYLLTVGAALLLYYLLAGFFSRYYGIPLTDYQSVSSMGKMSISTLFQNFIGCYRDFKQEITFLSFRPNFYINGYPNYLFFLLCYGLVAIGYILLKQKTVLKTVALLVLMVLAPFLLCSIRIFNPASVYSLMTYSVAALYLLGIVLLDGLPTLLQRLPKEDLPPKKARRIQWVRILLTLVSWLMILCLIVCLYAWVVGINLDYFQAKLDYENMYAQCSLLLQRAEATDGYQKNMPIYVLGTVMDAPASSRSMTLLNNPKSYYAFMKFYLGVQMPYGIANDIDDAAKAFMATDVYAAMPTYPADGSTLVWEGSVYLKLAPSR